MTVLRREIQGRETWEARYYISSLGLQAEAIATAIRKHWSIENSQHWVLDVALREHARRQQDRNGAAKLAAVRRLSLGLLRQEKTNFPRREVQTDDLRSRSRRLAQILTDC